MENPMRFVILFCAIAAPHLAFAAEDDAAVRKNLAGVWKGQVQDGATGHQITFTTDTVSGLKDGARDLGKGMFKVDLKTKPWTMDAVEIKTGGRKGRNWFGIFSLEADALKWCVSTNKRPTEFATGDGNFCLVLKRTKAAGVDLGGVWKGRVQDGATGHQITFAGGSVSGLKDGARDLGKGTYKVNMKTKPWTMDAMEVKSDGKKGRDWFGILTVKGDSLKWCVNSNKRPTTFATGGGSFCLVLTRTKGAPTTTPTAPAKATSYKVSKFAGSAPRGASAKIRRTLGPSGLLLRAGQGKAVGDVWLRADVPVLSANQSDRKYPLESGTLLGIIRVADKSTGDFRDLKIAPGTYTMRYGLQPTDDVHEYSKQFRDFIVLLSAADDTDPARITDAEDLSKRGIDTTGESHPAILLLRAPQADDKNLPAIVRAAGNDGNTELQVLVAKTSAKGGSAGTIQLEMVISGYAKE
jgi:uncharacterized protein (TIGR03067 family)